MKNRIFAGLLAVCLAFGNVPVYAQGEMAEIEEYLSGTGSEDEETYDSGEEPDGGDISGEEPGVEDSSEEEPFGENPSGEDPAGGDISGEEPSGGDPSGETPAEDDSQGGGLDPTSSGERVQENQEPQPTSVPELTVTPVPDENAEPEIIKYAGYLSELAVYSNGNGAGSQKVLERREDWDEAFGGTVYTVDYSSVDTSGSFFAAADLSALAPENSTIVMSAYTESGEQVQTEIPGDSYSQSMRYRLPGMIFSDGEGGGTRAVYTIKVGNREKQEIYKIVVCRTLELANIGCFSAQDEDLAASLLNQNYDRTVKEYSVLAPADTESLRLRIRPYSGAWFGLTVNGDPFASYDLLDVPVTEENTEIVLSMNQDGGYRDPEYAGFSYTSTGEYRISVSRLARAYADFQVEPQQAVVSLYDSRGDRVYSTIEEPFHFADLLEGETYHYNASAYGYLSVQGSFAAEKQNQISLTLQKADTEYEELTDNDWIGYQNSRENNGITEIKTPADTEETVEKWSVQLGGEWSSTATPPLILGGTIYTAAGKFLYKLDRETGEILMVSDEMAGSMTYALNPLAYGAGMIFAQIGNGQIQAFDAKTLKSLWVSEAIGGQTLSPITYKDGFVYTGTWNSETTAGDYFCLSVTDEDPSRGDEIKYCTWKYSHKGGFYWAGAYASDRYVVFGSDDGSREGESTDTSILYSVSTDTGLLIDKIDHLKGDIRTSAVYENGYIYFATKGGMLYRIRMSEDGHFEEISSFDLGGMATASPVVYKGRIYVGVCGAGGRFSADGGHHFDVLQETADGISLAYSVSVPGYPQAAAVLSTAYENEDFDGDGAPDGRVYLYFTYNAFPGGICMLADEPGKTKGTAESFYKPDTPQQQYCISPICVDRDGTLYYKNDSSYLIAVSAGGAYPDSLEVTADNGSVTWDKAFRKGLLSYQLTVGAAAKRIHLTIKAAEGKQVTVNGQPCDGEWELLLDENREASAEICVTAGTQSRTYHLKVLGAGENSMLSDLRVSTSNVFSDTDSCLLLEPEFSSEVTKYSTAEYAGNQEFLNLYVKTADASAVLEARAGSGVKNLRIAKNPAGANGYTRISVYFAKEEAVAVVKLFVTAADQEHVTEYRVNLKREDFYAPLLTEARLVRTGSETAELIFSSNEKGRFVYAIAALKEEPELSVTEDSPELEKGKNFVEIPLTDAEEKQVFILAKDVFGNVMKEPLKLKLPASEQVMVRIQTTPEKAKVKVTDENGREIKKTEVGYLLFVGNHYRVTVKCKGYETAKEQILAEAGKTEYVFTLKSSRNSDADLKALYVSSSRKYGSGILKLSPVFEQSVTAYGVSYGKERDCLYVWPQLSDKKASVKIYAVSGLSADHVQKNETIKAEKDADGRKYWPVYFGAHQLEAKVRICVTAEDGKKKDTFLTMNLTDQTAPVLSKVSASRISTERASVVFKSNEKGICRYQVTDAGEVPSAYEQEMDVQEGTTTLSLSGLTQGEKEVHIFVTDDSGNESQVLTIRIPDMKRDLNNGQGIHGTSGDGKISGGNGNGGNAAPVLKVKDGEGSASGVKAADGQVSHEKESSQKDGKKKKSEDKNSKGKKNGKSKASGNKKASDDPESEDEEQEKADAGEHKSIRGEQAFGESEKQNEAGFVSSAGRAFSELWNQWGWRSRMVILLAAPGFLFLLFWLRARKDYRKTAVVSGEGKKL